MASRGISGENSYGPIGVVTVLLSYLIRYGVCLHIDVVFGRMWSQRHGRLPAGLTAFDQHLAGREASPQGDSR
jgi:hypothetical protein